MSRPRHTAESLNSKLSDRGISLSNVYSPDEIIPTKIKIDFRCVHGHVWSAIPNSILNGSGCPFCSGNSPLLNDKATELLSQKGIKMLSQWESRTSNALFECSNGHIWESTCKRVLNSVHGCPHCAPNRPLTTTYVNDSLSERGIHLVGEYIPGQDCYRFMCNHGHEWETTVTSVLYGSGCPYCSEKGFRRDKPAWEYVFIRDDYIKYGITNDLDRRLNEHFRNGKLDLIHSKRHDVGQLALDWENLIKQQYGGRYSSKQQCPDGWTETLPLSLLDELKKFIISF